MSSLFKKLFRNPEDTHTSETESRPSPVQRQRASQEETIENYMALGPFRKYDCIFTANKIGDITNQSINLDDKVSQAINLIYHDLKLDFVLLWTIESDCKFPYMGAGKNIHLMLARREKNESATRW